MPRTLKTAIATISAIALLSPVFVFAQTASSTTQLIEQLKMLQAQMVSLQAQQKIVVQAQNETVAQLVRTLRQGVSGDDVSALQALLAADADLYPEGTISGFYGPLTAKAVKRFQKKHGLDQVGHVGPKTLKKLQEFLNDNQISFVVGASATSTPGNHGHSKKLCAKVPPGHLIAPGWLRKHNGIAPIVPECQKLPRGIDDRDDRDDDDHGGNGTTTDRTAPVLSSIGVTVSTSSAMLSWTTNEPSSRKALFGTTTSYGNTVENSTLSQIHSLTLNGLVNGTLYHALVSSKDAAGNTATSSPFNFTTQSLVSDITAPVISGIATSSVASTSATVSWNTNEAGTTKVYYSLATPIVLSSASTFIVGTLVTSHIAALTGLTASSTYNVVVESTDLSGNTATSSSFMLTTGN